ncbi:MAG: response regulator [Solirubrobacteraceae bacterium]
MARILIVDDNLMIRTLLREILSGAAHDVVGEAVDGLQASSALVSLRPELVTLDLVMPGLDGLATLEQLRIVDPSVLVVICSAWLTQRRVLAALALGANGFIAKPFDHQAVLDAVRRVLADAAGRRPPSKLVAPLPAAAPDAAAEDRREFTRVDAALPVVLVGEGAPIATVTIDVSAGGIRVAMPALAPGAEVSFELELAPGQAPVRGLARVVRSVGPDELALAFEQVSIADHERLAEYIERHRQTGAAGD